MYIKLTVSSSARESLKLFQHSLTNITFETFLFEIMLLYLLYAAFKFRTCVTCTEDLIFRLITWVEALKSGPLSLCNHCFISLQKLIPYHIPQVLVFKFEVIHDLFKKYHKTRIAHIVEKSESYGSMILTLLIFTVF